MTAQRTQRLAGQRRYSDARVARKMNASPARAPRTSTASNARAMAIGEAGLEQSDSTRAVRFGSRR